MQTPLIIRGVFFVTWIWAEVLGIVRNKVLKLNEVILQREMNADKSHADLNIDLSNYQDGLYIILVKTKNTSYTKKIIKGK